MSALGRQTKMTGLELTDVRSVVARSALLLLVAAGLVILPGLTHDAGLRAVIPWFVVLLMLQLAPLMWGRRPDLFAPTVYTGVMAAIGTAASMAELFVNGEVSFKLVTLGSQQEVGELAEKVLVALVLGTICYYIGYYTRIGVGIRKIFPKVQGLEWQRGRMILMCGVIALVFLVTYSVFQSRVGVSLFDVTQLGLGKSVWRDDPSMSWMMRGIELGFVPILFYLSWAMAKQRGPRSLILPVVVLVVVGLLSSRLGQRGTFPSVVVGVLVMFHYHRVRVPALLFLALAFIAITIGNITLAWRTLPTDEKRQFDFMAEASDPTALLASHESERQRFSGLALIMSEFPENHPYPLGESWAPIIALPIPRWLWKGKVEHFEWQDNRIIYRLGGPPMPAPFVGALYANLSWLGIVIGMVLFGAFHRGLYEWLLANPKDQNIVLLYSLILIYFGPGMLNISICLQYAAPAWLVIRFVGRRPAPAHPASAH
jgi:hypothetical protein